MKKQIVLVNQSTGYLFIDVANAFAAEYEQVILLAGEVVPMDVPLHSAVKVHRIAPYNRSSTSKRMFSWVKALLQVWWIVATKYRSAHLLVVSNPPTASTLLPLLVKRKMNLLVYDIYPDGLVAGSFVTPKSWLYRCWAALNRKAYKKVGKLAVLTPGMGTAMQAYAPREKIQVIPAWAASSPKEHKIDSANNLFIQQYGLQDKFLVMYSGNLGKEYALESLVYLAESLQDHPQLMFVIMGKGWKKERLSKLIQDKKLTNCLLLPYQTPELFMHSLNAFHIGVVSLAAAVARVAIPSKTYNLLAAQRPIFCIGSEHSDLADFLQQYEVGVAVDPAQIEQMRTYILKLYNEQPFYEQLCRNAAAAARLFTRERAAEIVALYA